MTATIVCDELVKLHRVGDVEVPALRGLDLTVDEGEVVAVIGPSGCGKSTLLQVLGGLLTPTSGSCRVGSHDLALLSEADRLRFRREQVGFVWQDPTDGCIGHLSVTDNVALGARLAGHQDPDRAAHDLLDQLALGELADRRPDCLSGGELQRVSTAAALGGSPSILLADEPTSSLDPDAAADVYRLFRLANEQLGTTTVIVSHDLRVADHVDRVIELRDGRTATERRSGDSDNVRTLLVDSAARLRLPDDWREVVGIGDRVSAELRDGVIHLSAPDIER